MIVALNNKCNFTFNQFKDYVNELKKIKTKHTMILCPSTINICLFSDDLIYLGAQNVGCYDSGAHTGEISAEQLKSYNVDYCIVGHSERRLNQKETNEEINIKIRQLLKNNIIPILCVGETEDERDGGLEDKIILQQLSVCLENLEKSEIEKIIIAYEPIWAIGTGIVPTNVQIENIINFIKEKYPNNKVLYGGSANENNIEELKKCLCIDGYLLGGISLKPTSLREFVNKL